MPILLKNKITQMLHETLPFALGLIFLIVLLVLLAKKIKVAYPILLVVAGVFLGLIPGVPRIKINPDLIFFIFLPPLLYEASWTISLKQLKKWWRIIASFAFLVVFFTATVVALCSNYFIPGFSIALGFLLGGIVSPPDAVSAGAILKFVKIPKSTSSILEGESLLNDASSLIIVRFALVAVGTGQFFLGEATLSFLWMAIGGAIIGLVIGWLVERINKILPTDAPADIVLSLLTPYLLYWVAELVHSSGVLAVVFGGLYISSKRFHFMNASSRIAGYNVWESFVYVLNGLVFMLIGLQLPEILEGIDKEGIPFWTAVKYGVLATGTLILVRIISSYVAMFSTLIFRRNVMGNNFSLRKSWKMPVILGWTGMRGVVSLAAALAIPEFLENGQPFPYRNLILFITFVVILLTLVIQGLTLPTMISKIGFFDSLDADEDESRHQLKRELSEFCLNYAKNNFVEEMKDNIILRRTVESWEEKLSNPEKQRMTGKQKTAYLKFLEMQRNFLIEKNVEVNLNEDLIRNQQHLIDLEEERVIHS